MMRYLIIKLLFFVLLAYTQIVLAESNDEKCSEILGSIIVETELKEQDKLNKWASYERTCSKDYFYYMGQAQIYGLQDTGHAINYIHKLLKEKKLLIQKIFCFF